MGLRVEMKAAANGLAQSIDGPSPKEEGEECEKSGCLGCGGCQTQGGPGGRGQGNIPFALRDGVQMHKPKGGQIKINRFGTLNQIQTRQVLGALFTDMDILMRGIRE